MPNRPRAPNNQDLTKNLNDTLSLNSYDPELDDYNFAPPKKKPQA